ncbi:MAG: AAA family ATPase, partial [Pseudobutyrivibrio sp.]|nr:AAA family ATPase [Pseudobutyrivibrio sp.]
MKKIGIGYENYKDFTDSNMYYVDKTLLIQDVIKRGGMVTLFTRPRRFGKTLALSMLRTFFEDERDRDGNKIDNSRYFQGRRILLEGSDDIRAMMGKYPIIKLSLKSGKQMDFYNSFMILRKEIIGEFTRHLYLYNSDNLSDSEKQNFIDLEHGEMYWNELDRNFANNAERQEAFNREVGKYAVALKTLSELLEKHHGRKAIILIDEYDVPLENAYQLGFYDEMIGFIRSLFESALKTNDALEFAVVIGCLRISKESIFTGLNNLQVNSINSLDFGEYFGFTQEDVLEMLSEYHLVDYIDEVKAWYNGYLFGRTEVYNPWSVINYVQAHTLDKSVFPVPYWSNTSSNSIIKEMIDGADENIKSELDTLISGGTIEKPIHEDITYGDIHENNDNLWNFLYFTGYMKKVSERFEDETLFMTMKIPNKEIAYVYKNQLRQWFDKSIKGLDYSPLYEAIVSKNTSAIEDFVGSLLEMSISYFDGEESFYHGFFLSLLYGLPNYSVRSNRESGNGRPDIVLYPNKPKDPAYIFELKARKKFNEMEDGLQDALEQIKTQKYEKGVLEDGYIGAVSYGICFCKKSCIVGIVG